MLDLPVISPPPLAEVLAQVERFERVLFVDESRAAGSPASHMMARVLDAGLPCSARLVCSLDGPAPFAPQLVDETEQRIADALRGLLV